LEDAKDLAFELHQAWKAVKHHGDAMFQQLIRRIPGSEDAEDTDETEDDTEVTE
jgi:hypothetical protein